MNKLLVLAAVGTTLIVAGPASAQISFSVGPNGFGVHLGQNSASPHGFGGHMGQNAPRYNHVPDHYAPRNSYASVNRHGRASMRHVPSIPEQSVMHFTVGVRR
jgi:hypothetical protein